MFIRNRNWLESQDDCDFKKSLESKTDLFLENRHQRERAKNGREDDQGVGLLLQLCFVFIRFFLWFVNVAFNKERVEDCLLVVMHRKEADKESPQNRHIAKKKGFERKLLTNFLFFFIFKNNTNSVCSKLCKILIRKFPSSSLMIVSTN